MSVFFPLLVVSSHAARCRFFGLNCLRSVVLAEGIKTSTFGSLHTIPSLWMSYVGHVFGVEKASRWGDAVASFVHSFN